MSWNDGTKRKQFKSLQKKQEKEYRSLGMPEENIRILQEFDKSVFNGDRRFYEHTQSLDNSVFAEDKTDESNNSLLSKFRDELSSDIDNSPDHSRYWWIDELENPALVERVQLLSEDDLDLLTLLVFEGWTCATIARKRGVTRQAIRKQYARIKNFLNISD